MFKDKELQNRILRIVLLGLGVGSISATVYLAGPFLNIGGWRPLENHIVRDIVILLLVTAAAGAGGWSFWKRKKKSEALAEGLSEDAAEDHTEVLSGRLKDALATLKKSNSGPTFLYDLPWYLIIGPPGAGKTTALVNSGLRFPLSGDATPEAIAGAGGTRYCDWWFSEDAVFVDTAGRYTTQDSDSTLDKRSWLGFLDLLKKNRSKQPINGVIVAISLQDVLTLSREELAAHARAIRARLLELHDRLKVDFPVYVLFTKTDLVAGFSEFFSNADSELRRRVFGATFQTGDKKKNLVAETPREFDALIERLNLNMLDRLQDEPNAANRVSLYGFPAQMTALKRPIHDFLNAIFEPTRYHSNANLRGFYFTSGTQQGSPIDQLINALIKNFGARDAGGMEHIGTGKSFFLYDVIQKVIIPEAAWVSTDAAAVRRAVILKGLAIGAILLTTAGLAGVWWKSYSVNNELIAASESFAKEYIADPAYPISREDTIADRDFSKTLGLLQKLRDAPTGYGNQDAPVSFWERVGFAQRPRLSTASVTAYRLGLERMLRPRLLYRLEEVLEQHKNEPGFVYEALKVYLMLGHVAQPVDRELVIGWERQDWRDNFFRGPMSDVSDALQKHLEAMLDLDTGDMLVQPNQQLIDDCQLILGRLRLSERAYQMLKSQVRALKIPDWTAAKGGGDYFDQVFEEASGKDGDSIRVSGFFTNKGFKSGFLAGLPGIAEKTREERWVLGKLGQENAMDDQYRSLGPDLLAIYGREYVAAWREALAQLRMKRLTADKPHYRALGAATAATSPIRLLFESIDRETALTREAPAPKETKDAKDPKEGEAAPDKNAAALNVALASMFADRGDKPLGEEIDHAFQPYHDWVAAGGGRRPIDDLIAELNEIKDNLITSATVPENSPQANAALAPQIKKLRATAERLPDPFRAMFVSASEAFDRDVNNAELARLNKAFGDQVANACQQVVPGRYPFVKSSANEIAPADFGRLFGVGGLFDSFFKQSLAKYVNASKRDWSYRPEFALTRGMSTATLREFQRAMQIRDAFFAAGGNAPSIALTVYPPVLHGSGVTVKFEVNGAEVVTQSGTSVVPRAIQWPGLGGGHAAVTLSYDQPAAPAPAPAVPSDGTQAVPVPAPAVPAAPALPPSILERSGAWALFRLLDAGAVSYNGDRLIASFVVGGRNLTFGLGAGSTLKPLTLPALREFHCPTQL